MAKVTFKKGVPEKRTGVENALSTLLLQLAEKDSMIKNLQLSQATMMMTLAKNGIK